MTTKKKDIRPGHGRLLDAWVPPDGAGEPVGCVATTFTFQPTLFEEECLGRFLQLHSDPAEDGPAYLVEREEKLAQLACAAVLVDQSQLRGALRSLRWDVLPARPAGGCFHAKISLMLWSRCARLVVASANLTEDGYRRNLEVFGVLDYRKGGEAPLEVLHDCLDFLGSAAGTCRESAVVKRWNDFLGRVWKDTRKWGKSEPGRVFAVLGAPGRGNVFGQLEAIRPKREVFTDAYVVSPFFDPPEAPNLPASEIWNLLKKGAGSKVEYDVAAEEIPGEERFIVHAPESLIQFKPEATFLGRIELDEGRPLHAKCLSLENGKLVLRMIGSSNFTSAGLGLGKVRNWEANLAYLIRSPVGELEDSWPECDELPDEENLDFKPQTSPEDEAASVQSLPAAFAEALFTGTSVELHFAGQPPAGWAIYDGQETGSRFADESQWLAAGSPPCWTLPWTEERAPSGFEVDWPRSAGRAWWPVNALDAKSLPAPADLRDLSLEALIALLVSTRPLHDALAAWTRRGRREPKSHEDDRMLDPHRRVDNSAFLLQRTRRVAAALEGLRRRLERPVASREALRWRLRGPVGAEALAQAIRREAQSPAEEAFLLLELCLELCRTKPEKAPGCLPAAMVRPELRALAKEIGNSISPGAFSGDAAMETYARNVMEVIGK